MKLRRRFRAIRRDYKAPHTACGQTRGYALLGEPYNYTGIENDHDFYESRSMNYELDESNLPQNDKKLSF